MSYTLIYSFCSFVSIPEWKKLPCCSEEYSFTCFKMQCCRHQTQIGSVYNTLYNHNNFIISISIYPLYVCLGLFQMYENSKFLFFSNHDGQQYVLFWLLVPPSLNNGNLPTSLQADKKGKKYIQKLSSLINGFFLSFLLILLWFIKAMIFCMIFLSPFLDVTRMSSQKFLCLHS